MSNDVKNVLIKASGDVFESKAFKYFVAQKAKESFVVIVVGGGTEISKRLEAAGYTITFDDVHGRITKSKNTCYLRLTHNTNSTIGEMSNGWRINK